MVFPCISLFVEFDTGKHLRRYSVGPDLLVLTVHPQRDAAVTMVVLVSEPQPTFGGLTIDAVAAMHGYAVSQQPFGKVGVSHLLAGGSRHRLHNGGCGRPANNIAPQSGQ